MLAVALAFGILVSRTPVEVPAGAEAGRRATATELEETRTDPRFGLERLTYLSDGLKVVAYLYGPRTTPAARRPVIVYLRGGYLAATPVTTLLPQFRTYAEAGYTVLAPQLRESDGGEGRDEVGGADLGDVMVVPALLAEIPGTDREHVYLLGESRGGMMAYQALRDRFPAKAAAVYGGFTDLAALLEEHPQPYEGLARHLWPDFAQRRDEIVRRRSAVQWADKLDTPILILHGGSDRSVAPSHAQRLAERLKALGKPHELRIFEGDGHTLPDHAAERDRLVLAWFARHR
jgi:dipeptidyl aminopeptidase/acylaminoacyl peptidase